MNERNTKAATCCCDGYHFPHRVGSIGCKFVGHGDYRHGAPQEMPGVSGLPF